MIPTRCWGRPDVAGPARRCGSANSCGYRGCRSSVDWHQTKPAVTWPFLLEYNKTVESVIFNEPQQNSIDYDAINTLWHNFLSPSMTCRTLRTARKRGCVGHWFQDNGNFLVYPRRHLSDPHVSLFSLASARSSVTVTRITSVRHIRLWIVFLALTHTLEPGRSPPMSSSCLKPVVFAL